MGLGSLKKHRLALVMACLTYCTWNLALTIYTIPSRLGSGGIRHIVDLVSVPVAHILLRHPQADAVRRQGQTSENVTC